MHAEQTGAPRNNSLEISFTSDGQILCRPSWEEASSEWALPDGPFRAPKPFHSGVAIAMRGSAGRFPTPCGSVRVWHPSGHALTRETIAPRDASSIRIWPYLPLARGRAAVAGTCRAGRSAHHSPSALPLSESELDLQSGTKYGWPMGAREGDVPCNEARDREESAGCSVIGASPANKPLRSQLPVKRLESRQRAWDRGKGGGQGRGKEIALRHFNITDEWVLYLFFTTSVADSVLI
jgi:hypothetical protein